MVSSGRRSKIRPAALILGSGRAGGQPAANRRPTGGQHNNNNQKLAPAAQLVWWRAMRAAGAASGRAYRGAWRGRLAGRRAYRARRATGAGCLECAYKRAPATVQWCARPVARVKPLSLMFARARAHPDGWARKQTLACRSLGHLGRRRIRHANWGRGRAHVTSVARAFCNRRLTDSFLGDMNWPLIRFELRAIGRGAVGPRGRWRRWRRSARSGRYRPDVGPIGPIGRPDGRPIIGRQVSGGVSWRVVQPAQNN